ncbi:F-box protein At5g07610-like isoform X1 [Mercurialis annua]|uniref:F-box protein At5g07610-like isoform X1 n=1 Tax=Mercurialis annua TaxID=3986 RepID=UPI0021610893|nr:F-box protein At5g07610-like isoform X1 [Mercurialis annua]XP_050238892.1 F-box protein At5g07610-like isoform X1 [Mercurialis annua]XP_050238893.1 F-box protein At5g07610-like isoform X1 [Mercurialis annua]XP_050238894.1 F-box protein At5g07610-like isoform X1 [Mercurialis annua]
MGDTLTEDLVVEILCRVPVKSLMQFKRVSKGWYNLISNVCAPKISCIASSAPLGFLFSILRKTSVFDTAYFSYPEGHYCDDDSPGFVKSCLDLIPSKRYKRLDLCNGLLLYFSEDGRYYVCNPTTKQRIAVPYVHWKDNYDYASLVFENFMSPHYKIIRFLDMKVSCSASSFIKLDVFSSATGNWMKQKFRIEQSISSSVDFVERTV